MDKAKILVADDIKQNVKLLKVILTTAGYDVIEAYDGEEALDKVKTENPDLILLDIMMPKITGFEVCQQLRENARTKNIPVVMITALHEMDDRIKGIEAGADDFISKPFNKTELLARIRSLLRLRKLSDKRGEMEILETLLPEITEGVIITDGQWRITNINPRARDILSTLEIQVQEPLQNDLLAYLASANLSLPLEAIINTTERNTTFQIMSSKNQHPFRASVKMTKSFDSQGNLIGVTFILHKD